MPHINDAGLELIAKYEGERLRAYPDPGSGGDPWTIGFGHTANVHPGQVCTDAQARAWLALDVHEAEAIVTTCVEVEITPNQFAALVSFEYNTGALIGSTLLRCVNERAIATAAAQFARWVYADGEALPGLVARRAAEANLFLLPG